MKKIWTTLFPTLLLFAFVPISAKAAGNSGDFDGGVAIGSSYAGANAAPTNGLIVQGSVAIGTTTPVAGGGMTVIPSALTVGTPSLLTVKGPADTSLTASTEATDINFNLARNVQFATGALTNQRAVRIQAPTYSFVGASIITNAATLDISGAPVAGTNATITNDAALVVESGSVGIGTTSPSSPLTVAGTIQTTSGGVKFPDGTIQTTATPTTLPTHQVFVSGSGTYTTPANVKWLEITLVGGGGGGGAGNSMTAGSAGGATCWNTSGSACTSPVFSAGGGGGGIGGTAGDAGGTGGTISGSGTCDWSVSGGGGAAGPIAIYTQFSAPGGQGGPTTLGGSGGTTFASVGVDAAANSGAGGGGGGVSGATSSGAGGGGGGATCHVIINNPAGSYTYAVGSSGAGNSSPGSYGFSGGNGAAGTIIVYEHYGS